MLMKKEKYQGPEKDLTAEKEVLTAAISLTGLGRQKVRKKERERGSVTNL